MPDKNFDNFVNYQLPYHYNHHVARLATLYPLLTQSKQFRCRYNAIAIKEGLAWLLRRWRWRLMQLQELGWHKLQDERSLQQAKNCWPAVLAHQGEKMTRKCHLDALCPWCYYRKIVRVYDNGWPALKDNPSVTLVSACKPFNYPVANYDVDIPVLLSRHFRALRKVIRLCKPHLGYYYQITVEPNSKINSHGREVVCWQVTPRLLLYTENVPKYLQQRTQLTLRQYKGLTKRRAFAKIMIKVCRYPVGLFYGPANYVLDSALSCHHRRLTCFAGCFAKYNNSKLIITPNPCHET